MFANMPETACCRGCEYLLYGLPEPICPECGRSFDPLDARTYDRSTGRKRLRRWAWRLTFVLGVAAVCLALFPQSRVTGRLVMTCQGCNRSYAATRTEYRPGRWIPIRYPGWFSESTSPAAAGACSCKQPTRVVLQIANAEFTLDGFEPGTLLTAIADHAPDEVTSIGSVLASRATAREFLRLLLRESIKPDSWDLHAFQSRVVVRDPG